MVSAGHMLCMLDQALGLVQASTIQVCRTPAGLQASIIQYRQLCACPSCTCWIWDFGLSFRRCWLDCSASKGVWYASYCCGVLVDSPRECMQGAALFHKHMRRQDDLLARCCFSAAAGWLAGSIDRQDTLLPCTGSVTFQSLAAFA